jgi:hypothetical protein
MSKSFQELSRMGYYPAKEDGVEHKLTVDDIRLGALMRIADALEKHDVLAKRADDLRVEVATMGHTLMAGSMAFGELEKNKHNLQRRERKLRRQIAGLKGHLGKINKKKGGK